MTHILMIRHGQSTANLDGLFAGQFDAPLTDLGIRQADCTAQFLAGAVSAAAIYASPLKRAFRTAESTAQLCGLPVIPEPGLQEIFAGKWEGQSFSLLGEISKEAYETWTTDIGNARCPEGEAVAELAQRVKETLLRIAANHPDQTVLLFTHATPVRAMCCVASGKPLAHMQQIPWASNASVTEFTVDNGVLTLGRFSIDAHLQHLKTNLPANV